MTLQQWAKAHNLETAKVVSAVKKLIAEGKLDEETAQAPSAEMDDRADRALQAHFRIGQEPTPSPAPANAENSAPATVGANGTEKPYVFTGEDPSRPGQTLVERLVPVKLFAVARSTDSLAMFFYGMDEADAIGQYVAIKNLGPQSHRHRFKCEWCDAPQIHLATRMRNDNGQQIGPNGYYHIVDTCETKKETRTTTDAQGREQTQQFWMGAQLLPWTKASYETESRRFLPNACLNWNREAYQFELTAGAA
ncbi:MAG TPA: hypothetical protein VFG04_03140 [Planctomycetaceae bacterium]|jgi:hypothetical protein|nr:hypothetical protein [Planctomycetaceae bacterium]